MKQVFVLDIRDFIDQQFLSCFQISVVVLCSAIAFMDGFDAQSMGYVASVLIASLHLTRIALGPLISVGLVGMMMGALSFGVLADRFGRKPVLVTCILMFGALSLITATARSLDTLRIFRLLTGFGL